MKKLKLLMVLSLVLVGVLANAATTTTAILTKATTLTANDAAEFQKTFGKGFSDHSGFSFKCKNNKCTVVSTKAGFSGNTATSLLNGRKVANFSSADKNFQLSCGQSSVSFCNVVQKAAILQ